MARPPGKLIRVAVRELPPPAPTAIGHAPAGLLSMPASVSAQTVGAVAGLALTPVCTVLAFLLCFALIREVGHSRSTAITYVNPLVAVLLGVIILGEPLTLGVAVGMPLILLGSVLGTARAPRRPGARPGERPSGAALAAAASPPTP